MVPKSRPFIAAAFCFWGLACASSKDQSGGRVIGGTTPILVSADPTSASPGTTVTIVGSGFSYVAAEDVVSVGGASVSASDYAIDDNGDQVLSFEVPADAPQGTQPLLVIVQSDPSNALDFTVTP